jgi:hypothetical protein
MSHRATAGYAQFLLKTLLKSTRRGDEFRANPNILAVCTIVVRSSHRRDNT